jgi:hypothetical protein
MGLAFFILATDVPICGSDNSIPTQVRSNRGTTMSLMQAQRQEDLKYPRATLLKSSNDLGWSTLFADLRSHRFGRETPMRIREGE